MQTAKNFYQKRFTGNYGDGMYDITALMKLPVMKAWVREHKSFNYLETGSGSGRFACTLTSHLRKMGSVSSGVSFSDLENHLSSQALNLGKFTACDLGYEPLPYGDGSFDLVVCNHVLEHLFETEKALRDLRRVTAPGGVILLGVPNIGNWYSRIMFLFGFMPLGLECGTESVTYGKGFGKNRCRDYIPSGHIRGFNARTLREICEHCGLKVEAWWNQGTEWESKLLYRYLGAVIKSC